MQRNDTWYYFFISSMLHVIVLLVLIASFEFSGKMPVVENTAKDMKIVSAMVVDQNMLQPPKPVPLPTPPKVEPKPAMQPPSPPPKLVQKKSIEVVVKPKAIVIPDKQKKINKDDLAKKLLADMKEQVEKQKKLSHKALESALAKEVKLQAQKVLQQQLLNEQKNLAAAARAAQSRGEVNKYKALILQAISQQWLIPANVPKNLTSELLIRVAPSGIVLDVQIIKGSGNPALDRSARAAVFKASPLPVPKDPSEFDAFRQFVLKVKPENVLNKDTWAG